MSFVAALALADTLEAYLPKELISVKWPNDVLRAHNVPGPVTVRLPHESFEGDALGLDANGALRVRLAGGTIRDVHAGDVFFGSDKAN